MVTQLLADGNLSENDTGTQQPLEYKQNTTSWVDFPVAGCLQPGDLCNHIALKMVSATDKHGYFSQS